MYVSINTSQLNNDFNSKVILIPLFMFYLKFSYGYLTITVLRDFTEVLI